MTGQSVEWQCVRLWSERYEVQISGQVKLDTVSPMVCHCRDISLKGAVMPGRKEEEMGPANSLHASAYYGEYKMKTLIYAI